MTKEELLESYRLDYSYYQSELDMECNKLARFYNFIPQAYEMAKFERDASRAVRIINVVKRGTTRVFWPVTRHFHSYPVCSFYDADNELLKIREEMALKYQECLDTLMGIADEDNISVIYPLMRVTYNRFFHNFAFVGGVSLKLRDAMIGEEIKPIDYTGVDVSVFLNFFDGVLGGRETLDSHGIVYQKKRELIDRKV